MVTVDPSWTYAVRSGRVGGFSAERSPLLHVSVAQLVERPPDTREVRGSSPLGDTPTLSPEVPVSLTNLPPHAMINQCGDLFYPDSADDARYFAVEHHAWAVLPLVFPYIDELADTPGAAMAD